MIFCGDMDQRIRSTTTKHGIWMIFSRLGSTKQKHNKQTRNFDDILETWIKEVEEQQTNKEF